MNKSTFFSGQPIFTQLLKFIPKSTVATIARDSKADWYSKRFSTYEHLVTMLYSIFNNCNSLREVATGMLASEQRLSHIGIRYHPRRSTISDANNRRKADVFGEIYYNLYHRYAPFLSDSRKNSKASRLYIFDATTISLFQEVLRTSGKNPSGKRKGGIKVHTLIRSDQDVPCLIRYSAAAANDSQYLKEVQLPKGSVIVFDRGYYDFTAFNRFTNDNITWVTRRRKLFTYEVLKQYTITDNDGSIISDEQIQLGWRSGIKVIARLVIYKDAASGEQYEFISNNFKMKPDTIAKLYQKRWQIELFFKRMKQSYPLKYFLGDSENAIKIQIWCTMIADLILKIVKKGAAVKWSFSNLAAIVRLHLMTYIDLAGFLKSPERALLKIFSKSKQYNHNQFLLIT
jgi:Transposase DDE domain/Domain of unknown function (DUF4372)